MGALRVMPVDDAVLVREGIARLLRDEGIDVVAQRAGSLEHLDCRPAGDHRTDH